MPDAVSASVLPKPRRLSLMRCVWNAYRTVGGAVASSLVSPPTLPAPWLLAALPRAPRGVGCLGPTTVLPSGPSGERTFPPRVTVSHGLPGPHTQAGPPRPGGMKLVLWPPGSVGSCDTDTTAGQPTGRSQAGATALSARRGGMAAKPQEPVAG